MTSHTNTNQKGIKMNMTFDGEAVSKMKKSQPKKVVVYYCTKGQYSFKLPKYEIDPFGKVVRNGEGKPKQEYQTDADGNNKVPLFDHFKFSRVPIPNETTGKTDPTFNVGRFVIDPGNPRFQELVDRIEYGRANKYNGILTEAEFRMWRNPKAAKAEDEKNALLTENQNLNEEIERLKSELSRKNGKT